MRLSASPFSLPRPLFSSTPFVFFLLMVTCLPLFTAAAGLDKSTTTNSSFPSTHHGLGCPPLARRDLTLAQATSILDTAIGLAASLGVAENVAVVDTAGFLLVFARMDEAFLGGVDLAIKKARGAVLFNGLASAELYAGSLPGGGVFGLQETNGGLVFFPGGLPLYNNGILMGAIGCSGGSPDQDLLIAKVGVEWLANSTESR